jgi:hypothetical protein
MSSDERDWRLGGGVLGPAHGSTPIVQVRPGSTLKLEMFAFIKGSVGKLFRQIVDKKGLRNQAEFDRAVAAVKGTWAKEPGPIGGMLLGWYFGTDNRDFGGRGTYRLGITATINTSDIGKLQSKGSVFTVDCTASHHVRTSYSYSLTLGGLDTTGEVKMEEQLAPATSSESGADSQNFSRRDVKAAASYPFSGAAPDIDIKVEWHLRLDPASGKVHVTVKGKHDQFPFYEVLVNSKSLYQYIPANDGKDGPGPVNLNSTHKFEATGSF